MSYYYL